MAEVQTPIVPSRLYRYRSLIRSKEALQEEIDSIQDRYIYCSEFTQMNDPMEGFFRPSKLLTDKSDYARVVRAITKTKSGIGIACFSETYESAHMWAHYAGNYGGICIGYSSADLLRAMPQDARLARVTYVDEEPLLFPSQTKDTRAAALRVLSQKEFHWAHEREWRILGNVGPVSYARRQSIRDIFFGSRIDAHSKRRILDAIKGTSIGAWMMQVDGYKHCWEEAEPPRRKRRR